MSSAETVSKHINCPGCKADIDVEVEIPKKYKVGVKDDGDLRSELDAIKKMVVDKNTKAEEESKSAKPKVVMPAHIPGFRCDDCGEVHPNKNHNRKIKGKCNNCDQFSPHKDGKCPWCKDGEIEEMDDDDLEDLGVKMPAIPEHDHE